MSRKANIEGRNPGSTYAETITDFFDGPSLTRARVSAVMVERVLLAVLRGEFERLTASTARGSEDLTRLFSHIFDPLAGEDERRDFATHLARRPPTIVLGYPRATVEIPIISVVLGEESESDQSVLGDYVGETMEGEEGPAADFIGAHFTQTFNVFVYADNPDVCAYLYHVAKLILFAAKPVLQRAGLVDPRLSGGDLAPDEGYVPENMFVRVLRVSCQSLNSMPLLKLDPARYRLGGLFRDDVVVDGIVGGVHTFTSEEET